MASIYTRPKTHRPRQVIKSEDANGQEAALENAFASLGDKAPTGKKGVSTPFYVGTPTEPNHAVTKQIVDDAETGVTTKAAEAAASATAAATSESNASTSETNAASSASSAATSATAAAASQAAASTSETNAASSASSAATSSSSASSSASAASTSETNAASSAAAASTSETAAASSASAASTSETNAASSASSASASATAAEGFRDEAQTAAAGSLKSASNLSDLGDLSDALSNLGLSSSDSVTFGSMDISGSITGGGNLTLGSSGNILVADSTSALVLAGDTSGTAGGNIVLWGGSNTGKENDIWFRGGSTLQLEYDDSDSEWDFGTNDIRTGGRFNADVDGSAAAPTFIVNDGDTGLYRRGNNQMGVTAGGTSVAYFTSSALIMEPGQQLRVTTGNAAFDRGDGVETVGYIGNALQLLGSSGATRTFVVRYSDDFAISRGTTRKVQLDSADNFTLLSGTNLLMQGGTVDVTSTTAEHAKFTFDNDASTGGEVNFYKDSGSPANADNLFNHLYYGRNSAAGYTAYARVLVTSPNVTSGSEDGTYLIKTYKAGSSVDSLNVTAGDVSIPNGNLSVDTGYLTESYATGITAGSTQTQAGATLLSSQVNLIGTVGTTGDGVKLPALSDVANGTVVEMLNAAASSAQVWPNTNDAIDANADNAVDPSALAAGASRRYIKDNAAIWRTLS